MNCLDKAPYLLEMGRPAPPGSDLETSSNQKTEKKVNVHEYQTS